MIPLLRKTKTLFATLAILLAINVGGHGQTNPAPVSLPYTQDFSALAHSSTTYPAGWQGWTLGTTSPGSSFRVIAPTADRALTASSSASTITGNVHNYNGKIGFLNIGGLDLSIVFAVSTLGQKDIQVAYDIMTIRNPHNAGTNTRINEVTLQYRVGTTGNFTNLTGIEYQNNATTQTTSGVTTPQNLVARSITLPAAVNNAPVVQLRWASREISGAGDRPSFAVDNISVTGTPIDFTPPVASFTPVSGAIGVLRDIHPIVAFDEMIFTTTGAAVDNSNVAGLISLRENDAAGAEVPFTATIVNGRNITIVPASLLKNGQLYYLAVAPVRNADGFESAIQSATFTVIGNDATLSAFTIGGVNVLQLDGLEVSNPTQQRGAFMAVGNFAAFAGGIVATPTDSKAQIEVHVNDITIPTAQLPALTFARGDVVVVSVTAEDATTVKHYKVTLWEEIPIITITSPSDGTPFFVMQTLNLTWQANTTGLLGMNVTYPDLSTQILDAVDASAGVWSIMIPNGIPAGSYKFELVWMDHPVIVSNPMNFTVTDNIKPSVFRTHPRNGDINVAVDLDVLRIEFDERIFAASGNIYVMKALDQTVHATIPITGSEVVINGNELEITLPYPMATDTEYYLVTDPGIVRDINGLLFDGILDNTTMRWTTAGYYDITIVVTDGTSPIENALVVLHTNPSRQLLTNAQGVVIFENVEYGSFGLLVMGRWWGFIEADRDKTVPVIHIPDGVNTYEVIIDVAHNGQPISWAKVELEGYGIQWADAAGRAIFAQVLRADNIPFIITHSEIQTFEGTVTVVDQSVVVPVAVRKVYDVYFIVTDIGGAVGGARVEFDGRVMFTTHGGFAIFDNVVEGTGKAYTISKPGYVSYSGIVTVDNLTEEIHIILEKERRTVTFNVADGVNPVAGAVITVAGQPTITTNAQGVAIINLIPGQYTYSVSADGFVGTSGTPFTVADIPLTVQIILSGLNVNRPVIGGNIVTVYPNPSDGVFTIEVKEAAGQSISIEILDISGKRLYLKDFPVINGSLQEVINLQNINKGIYFIRINDGDDIVTRKLIIR